MDILSKDIKKNIKRTIEGPLKECLFKNKTIVLYGARQVGKTTLVKKIESEFRASGDKRIQYLNCDLTSVSQALLKQEESHLSRIVGDTKLLIIDEAQRVENIGLTLKILHDNHPEVQIIATGSSSFDLANKVNEPLTGRLLEFKLYPIGMHELLSCCSFIELQDQLYHRLIYGNYPDIINAGIDQTRLYLDQLCSQYLYKDVLSFETLKNPSLLNKLLQLLSLQLGNEVSTHELAVTLQVSRNTIERYIDLLEKSFVIFRLRAFSRNLRKEINKKFKVYFYDLGIRNSLIQRYNDIELRDDVGALWENFCILERLKLNEYSLKRYNYYFWRTHDQQEIDYIEEYDGQLHGFEFKWNPKAKHKIPNDFLKTYDKSSFSVINTNNCWDFILP
jgi:uncharacterized protein